ncbi:unnamed protein product [Vitrella brassicaformis CCMP3155]|uniref:Uncharacterized protein n=1 Tax=Vitrella brassicaformis (strain CCMP3155) TaxID=1169540 RepID=A0A0G4G0G8_VITBC|nr:unnamed protein product [Vitrella brassicaformis CCMP3155]|eukprot:CEM21254.1 unnamed protein product [Vitrella brassicaformis CCMP3155]
MASSSSSGQMTHPQAAVGVVWAAVSTAGGGMSSTSASAAAAGGGGGTGVFGVNDVNHSATHDDEQSKSSDLLACMVKLHHQMGDSIRYLAAKGSVVESHLSMLERAIADTSSALGRLNGLALLEGHFKNFAFVPPDDEVEEGWRRIEPLFAEESSSNGDLSDHSSDAVDSQTETVAQGRSSRFADKAVTDETTKATKTQKKAHLVGFEFVRQLYTLPEALMHDTLLPLIHQHPHTALAKVSSALCCTSPAVGSAVAAALIPQIDSIIQRDGLSGVTSYTQIRRHLQRQRQLPIKLTGDDLQHVGSKAVVDSRPPSMRQYALFSHRLSEGMQLTRDANGEDELGVREVTVHSDAADPPCRHDALEYGSCRGLIIKELAWLSSCREGDDFAAYIIMTRWPDRSASISLRTSEAPQQGVSGPAAFQRAVDIAHKKMGDAITVLPKVNEAINTAGGMAST